MAQVKLPQIKVTLNSQYDTITTEEEQWNQVNPSCLLAYLGIRGFANISTTGTKNISKNALPILAYYDIFKNYYANTQEENFYIIGAALQLNKICYRDWETDRKSTRLNSSHITRSRMPSSA